MSLFNTHWKAILKHYATPQPMLWFLLWSSWLSLRLLWNLGLSGWHWDIIKGRGFPQHIRCHWQSKLPDLSCTRHRLNPHPLWHEKEWNEGLMLLEKGKRKVVAFSSQVMEGNLNPTGFCLISASCHMRPNAVTLPKFTIIEGRKIGALKSVSKAH